MVMRLSPFNLTHRSRTISHDGMNSSGTKFVIQPCSHHLPNIIYAGSSLSIMVVPWEKKCIGAGAVLVVSLFDLCCSLLEKFGMKMSPKPPSPSIKASVHAHQLLHASARAT
jgi:hypothetical protein